MRFLFSVSYLGSSSSYLWRVIHSVMVTYYCISIEEALRRAKMAGKKPSCYYGGITLPSGKKGFAIYKDGKVIEKYSVIKKDYICK